MAESIDELQIEITASSDKASQSIDKLCKNLEKLKTGIASIDTSGFTNSMKTITDSLKGLSNIKISGFSSFAKNINQLGNMDNSKIVQMSTAIKEFGNSVQSLGNINVSDDVAKMSELARSISRLGTSAAGKAVTNMPQLASALNSMMAQLQKAPKVSQNLIDMTNALANFARTGSSGGRAATSLGNSVKNMSGKFSGVPATLKRFDSAISKSVGKIKSFKSSILSAFGAVGGIYAAINGIKKSIDIASDLTEVQNVVDVTFGNFKDKIESLAAVSIPELGMSELTVKQIASRFQAMGTAMGIARGEMADMSVDLTRLAGDMSSFYNVAQEDVAQSLQSVFTGETKPLRKYGLDLTQATLKEWALKNGIDADIKSMSQMEKTMLRYQYVMANTTAAQGDFIRTADTWANQVRILKEQLKQLAGVLGTAFINALKPLVSALNSALSSIISFAQTVVNALGKIFGWKIKISNSGIASDFDSAASGADDIAGSTGKAAKNVDKMKAGLRAFDELKTIDTSGKDSGSGGGGGAGAAGGAGAGAGDLFQLEETESAFKSKIKDLEGLGEYIGNALKDAMDGIKWDEIYEKARGFGSGLASFLNGLFDGKKGETLLGKVGKTIAGTLNTVINASLGFTDNFDFEQFGINLSDAVNNFFTTFDFAGLADAINGWVDGFWETVTSFFGNLEYGDIFNGLKEFITNLSSNTIATIIGIATIKKFGGRIVKSICDNVGDIGGKLAIKLGEKVGSIALTSVLVVGIVGVSFSLAKSLSEMFFDWYNEKYGTDYDTIKIEDMSFLDVVVSGFKLSFNENGKFQILGLENLKKLFPENEVVNTIYGLLNGSLLTAFQNLSWDEFWSGFSNGGTGNLVDDVKKKISDVFSGIGDWFDKNVASPVSDTFEKMCISISGFFSGLWNGIKKIWEKVSSWFNDKVVSPVSGFFEGLCTRIGQFFQGAWLIVKAAWKIVSDWFNEKVVTPIKTKFGEVKTKIENAFKDAKQYVIDKWNSIKDWFESNVIAPIKTKFGSVKDKITKSFGDAKQSVTDKWSGVKKWFSEHVLEPIKEAFKKTTDKIGGFFTSLWKSIKSGVASAFNSVISGIESAINGIVGGINKLISGFNNVAKKAGEIVGQDYSGVDKVPTVSLPRIKGYKAGGFPDRYSLFMAGENGIPEIAGTVGGKPAVAGGAEITGIKDAINSTSAQEVFLLRQQNQLLQAILQKNFGITTNDIGKAARDYGREYYNRTGDNVYVF